MDSSAAVALLLVPCATEVASRLTKRLPWLKGKPRRLRAGVIRATGLSAGVVARLGIVQAFALAGLGPGLDTENRLALAYLVAQALVESAAAFGLYDLTKKPKEP